MRFKALIIIVAVIAAIGGAWIAFHRQSSDESDRIFDRSLNVLPAEVRNVLDSAERFVLLSLDPTRPGFHSESDPPPKELFHDYAVLGKTEIRDAKERAELLRALYKGIADSDGSVAACFNPRHGITATLGGETVDLVICFECLGMAVYGHGNRSVLTTDSPKPTFNRALERAHLPMAKSN